MVQCPVCQCAIQEDYGVITCPKCGAVMMVDLEGRVLLGEEPASETPIVNNLEPDLPLNQGFSNNEHNIFEPIVSDPLKYENNPEVLAPEVSSPEYGLTNENPFGSGSQSNPFEVSADLYAASGTDANDSAGHNESADNNESADVYASSSEDVGAESIMDLESNARDENSTSENEAYVFDSTPPSEPEDVNDIFASEGDFGEHEGMGLERGQKTKAQSDGDDFEAGIEEFANSARSSAREGLYLYELTIGGLDTQEISKDVRKVLEDSRLELEVESLFALERGRAETLKIRDIGPVKVSVILSKLQSLPVTVSWEQYLVHGEEG